ncbi:hypothetical protein RHSIM_Rhsim10G0121400 [Rhododendron simsii]|uniref:Protein kinase domain-containing protein n=1 Tax=Rhododendron simsii TaxID=118357 RepID=A0A834GF00_RHOSS|nr:hypothetical protein RHSIM_Rhsim10G0121400 [Rhododendron simsii]
MPASTTYWPLAVTTFDPPNCSTLPDFLTKSRDCGGSASGQSELDILRRFSHPNLVKLLGYCWEENELLLIYEYVPKGSLEKHLLGWGSAVQPLPWDIRLIILIGAARGLGFLRTSDKQVIYRHFKSSNILLDESYKVKMSAIEPRLTTPVMGTYGYAAPEYITTVLVEMLTSLRVFDGNSPSAQSNLVDWVKPCLLQERKLVDIMDSRLEGEYSKASFKIAQLALKCLALEQKTRPSMKAVVETLEHIEASNGNPWILCTIDLHFPTGKREFRLINSRYEHGGFDIMLPMKSGL